MLILHAGRTHSLPFLQLVQNGRIQCHFRSHFFQHLLCDKARTQNPHCTVWLQCNDCGFNAHGTCSAVHNCGNFALHIPHDMLCRCRAGITGNIGGRSCDRYTGQLDQCPCHRVRGHTNAHRIQPAGSDLRYLFPLRENHGQRSRPEPFCQFFRQRRHRCRHLLQCPHFCNVHDQRIVCRSAFCRKDLPHCLRISGICRQSVDGFRGHSHHGTVSQQFCRFQKVFCMI